MLDAAVDDYGELRRLLRQPDCWIQLHSVTGTAVVATGAVDQLLADFDAERRRRAELEAVLLDLAE